MSVFGSITTPTDVENAVIATLEKWSLTYIREMERHDGRTPGLLDPIKSFRPVAQVNERFPEYAIPAVDVVFSDDIDLRTTANDMTGAFKGTVDVLVESTEEGAVRELASLYNQALGLALQQNVLLDESVKIIGFGWVGMGIPAVGPGHNDHSRWLALGTNRIVLTVEGVGDPMGGPDEPTENEPPERPVIEGTGTRAHRGGDVIEPAEHDYTVYHGADFQVTMVLYSDARCKRWRGTFNEEWEYVPGDGVQAEDGTAWVCTDRVQFTGPLTGGQSQWSPVAQLNAAGYTFQLVSGPEGSWAGFTYTPSVTEPGTLNVSVPHADFAAAPGSAHYYLKMTSEGGTVSYPLRGTMLFRQP